MDFPKVNVDGEQLYLAIANLKRAIIQKGLGDSGLLADVDPLVDLALGLTDVNEETQGDN